MRETPTRIQRKRTRGWRMPAGAVYVGRPTVWGNPWGMEDGAWLSTDKRERAAYAVAEYRRDIHLRGFIHYDLSNADAVPLADVPNHLGGLDLVCWCALDMPCHADVLLNIANAAVLAGCATPTASLRAGLGEEPARSEPTSATSTSTWEQRTTEVIR